MKLWKLTCRECIDVNEDEDPSPWCDCRWDDTPCNGPCKQRAHHPKHCPDATEVFPPTPPLRRIDTVTADPLDWNSYVKKPPQ